MHARRILGPAVAVGLVAAAAIHERRILRHLAATPDPDAETDFAFPAERTHGIPASDGGSIHVAECGSGPPVVLLHGHGATSAVFSLLARQLAAGGRRVVAFDHRGFGRSSAVTPGFGFDGLVDDAATVLEYLDLRDATLLGHSMGGAVALGLVLDRPAIRSGRVAALVLINSSARGPADRLASRAQAAALDWPIFEGIGRHPRHGIALARANFGAEPRRSHVVAARAAGHDSPAAHRRGLSRRLLGIDLTPRLAELRLPVLVLAGSEDRVLGHHESERIAELVPGARLELFAGAGHMLPLERSAEVAARILRFMRPVGVELVSFASD